MILSGILVKKVKSTHIFMPESEENKLFCYHPAFLFCELHSWPWVLAAYKPTLLSMLEEECMRNVTGWWQNTECLGASRTIQSCLISKYWNNYVWPQTNGLRQNYDLQSFWLSYYRVKSALQILCMVYCTFVASKRIDGSKSFLKCYKPGC